jgi:hypothetical protein
MTTAPTATGQARLCALLDRLDNCASATPPAGGSWRQLRLARGWQPVQLIGRMKILAGHQGITLPHTWFLIRLVFLWENQRAAVPGFYAGLLRQVYTTPTVRKAG